MNGILTALLLTLIAGAATGIGGALVLFKKKLSSNTLAASLGLSAGVMIFISLAELLPEAQAEIVAIGSVKYGEALTLLAFFGGMGIIMLIDFLVPEYENPHEVSELSLEDGSQSSQSNKEKALHKLGILSALAIAIHNFPEGIATFIGALNDPQMGASITFAISIHNIPEGIAVAIPIYYATKSKGKALLYATLSGFSLRILLDRSMLEVYVDGLISFTTRIYPKYGDSDYLRVFDNNANVKFTEFTVYRMGSAYSDVLVPPYYGNVGNLGDLA